MTTRDKLIEVIRANIDVHEEDKKAQFVDCSFYLEELSDKLIESGLVVEDLRKEIDLAVQKELKEVAVKYYPCFNRMQQKEIAHRCGISHQELEREFYKPYIEKHGHLPIIGDREV